MTMRRSDFKAIAEVLNKSRLGTENDLGKQVVKDIAYDLCPVFKASNASFDKDKFIKACGYYQE